VDRVEFEGHPLWATVAEFRDLLRRADEVADATQRRVLDQLRYDQLRYVVNGMRAHRPPPEAGAAAKVTLDRLDDQMYAASTELAAFLSDRGSGHLTHAAGLIDRALHRLGVAPSPPPGLRGPHRGSGDVGPPVASVQTTRRFGTRRGSPQMTGHHRPRHAKRTSAPTLVVGIGALALAVTIGSVLAFGAGGDNAPGEAPNANAPECTVLRVVSTASYRAALDAVRSDLSTGVACVDLEVTVADGRDAEQLVDQRRAHVWITDDAAWLEYNEDYEAYDGSEDQEEDDYPTLATSPVLFVSSSALATSVRRAGDGWTGLATLIDSGRPIRIVSTDPATSGDGLVAIGGLGDAVWDTAGMDASALLLNKAYRHHRTTRHLMRPARAADEIALVPEHLLGGVPTNESAVTLPSDRTVLMRYSWYPTDVDADDAAVRAARARLLATLRDGAPADRARAAAHLRDGQGVPPPTSGTDGTWAARELPPANPVMDAHRVEHVFATWYADDRKADLLVVVDVSGSMAAPAPGSERPLIGLVRENVRHLADQLPNDARLGVWGFGSHLDGDHDYVVVDRLRGLTPPHRLRLSVHLDRLAARNTGTGLHDTVLASYRYALAEARQSVDFHVMVFTDGLNQDDPGAVSARELRQALGRLAEPDAPVGMTVVKVGKESTTTLEHGLRPVDGEVVTISSVHDILATFIHLAAGGLHE
jgi:hypothetical protein